MGHPSRRTSSHRWIALLASIFQFSRSFGLLCWPVNPTRADRQLQSVRPSPPTRAPTLPPAIAQHSYLVLVRIGTTQPPACILWKPWLPQAIPEWCSSTLVRALETQTTTEAANTRAEGTVCPISFVKDVLVSATASLFGRATTSCRHCGGVQASSHHTSHQGQPLMAGSAPPPLSRTAAPSPSWPGVRQQARHQGQERKGTVSPPPLCSTVAFYTLTLGLPPKQTTPQNSTSSNQYSLSH